MPDISLIIVNYNGKSFLGELLESVARQSHPAKEVILVDNASTDGSVEYLHQFFPWVKTIPLRSNAGFAEGNNIGVANAKGDYIALLNSDTVVDPNYLSEMIKALEADDSLGAVVPKILKMPPDGRIEGTGAQFNNLGNCWGRGFNQPDQDKFSFSTEVPGISACATLLRRRALSGQPLFDPDFFMYYEELELSLRLRGRGWGILYVPTAVIFHKGNGSVKKVSNNPLLFTQFYGNRNRMKILAKYYSFSVLIQSLPLILLSFLYWNWFFLKKGGFSLLFRAATSQVRYGYRGIKERLRGKTVNAHGWLPWMTRHNLRDILAIKAMMENKEFNLRKDKNNLPV